MGYGCLITQPSYTHNFPKTKAAINNRALLYMGELRKVGAWHMALIDNNRGCGEVTMLL